jgi:hypothetical protein
LNFSLDFLRLFLEKVFKIITKNHYQWVIIIIIIIIKREKLWTKIKTLFRIRKVEKMISDDLKLVINYCKSHNKTPFKASKEFGIPQSTFRNHLKEKSSSTVGGRPPVFRFDEESIMVDYLISLSKMGHGFDIMSFKQVIKDFVVKFKKETLFKNNTPGKDWITG